MDSSGLRPAAAAFVPGGAASSPPGPAAAATKAGDKGKKAAKTLTAAASAAPFVPSSSAAAAASTSPPGAADKQGRQSSGGGGGKGNSKGGQQHKGASAAAAAAAAKEAATKEAASKAATAAAAKMSPSASAFVPGTAASTTRTLRSPGCGASSASSASSAAAAPAASPSRLGAGGSSGRGGRGGSIARGGSSAAGNSSGGGGAFGSTRGMSTPPSAAAAVAAAAGAMGSGGGAKRALLAQAQGSYGSGGFGYGHQGSFGGGPHHHHHHTHHAGAPGKQLLSSQYIPEGLRQQLQQSNYLIQLQYTPSPDELPLPDKVGHFHSLYPLEELAGPDAGGVSAAWGVRTTCLKGLSTRDGRPYCLRVVCGKQVIPSLEMLGVVRSAVEAWSCLAGHPGLLVPVEGLVASEVDGCPSLVVVSDFVPGAVTLAQAHLQPTQTASGQLVRNTPNEEQLWSYTTQLAAVLRAAHSMGLALRPSSLSTSKVLVTPIGRLKMSGLGVPEALAGEVVPASADDLLQLQRDDVVAMGQLLLQLACAAGSLPVPSLDFASAHYSPEFVRLLMLLLGVADGGGFSWRAVSALLGERLLLEMDALAMFNEQLLDALTREMENGRLFRLMSKLAFVTDRNSDPAAVAAGGAGWCDTGDRYLLQLFRDFVFHQGEGGRTVDWGHILENLNKLDAGVSEQVLLQSRDERSLLVVSYADIKRCVEAAIAEIRRGGGNGLQPPPGAIMGGMRPPTGMYRGVHMGGSGMR